MIHASRSRWVSVSVSLRIRAGSIGRSDESLRASEAAGRKRESDESISVGFRCAMVEDGRAGKGCNIYSLLVGEWTKP